MRLLSPPALAHPVDTFVAHPVDNVTTAAKKQRRKAGSAMSDAAHDACKKGRKVAKKQRKLLERSGEEAPTGRTPRTSGTAQGNPRQHHF